MALEYDQIRNLLESEPVRRTDQRISEQVGLPIRDTNPAVNLKLLLAEVSASAIPIAELLNLLEQQSDRIVEFAVRNMEDGEDFGEEYPAGEEPDPDDPPSEGVATGIIPGTSVIHAIYVCFLQSRTQAELRAYLKKRRMPHHVQVARDLRRIYESFTQ